MGGRNELFYPSRRQILVLSHCRRKVGLLLLDERGLLVLLSLPIQALEVICPRDDSGHPFQTCLHLGSIHCCWLGAKVQASIQDPLLSKTERVVAVVGGELDLIPHLLPFDSPVFSSLYKSSPSLLLSLVWRLEF